MKSKFFTSWTLLEIPFLNFLFQWMVSCLFLYYFHTKTRAQCSEHMLEMRKPLVKVVFLNILPSVDNCFQSINL